MKVSVSQSKLSGVINVPGSKSHTIRACIFATLAEGVSKIYNPLPSEDCNSAANVIAQFGAKLNMTNDCWTVDGAGKNFHLPDDVVNVGNSGSLLYFMSAVSSVLEGATVFTGDSSIRTRPVRMMTEALEQLGVKCIVTHPKKDAPPVVIQGKLKPGELTTTGKPSQYVSGIMIAASLCNGLTTINLTDPKETPYLQMTIDWMASLGRKVRYSEGYKKIQIEGTDLSIAPYKSFSRTIPADWEAAAFPLLAGLITDSKIEICDIECSGQQGDQQIVEIMQQMGGNVLLEPEKNKITVSGGNPLTGVNVNCVDIPDAIPALAILACFAYGETRLTDIGVCRLKETDRIALMEQELTRLGASVSSGEDYLCIQGMAKKGELPQEVATRMKEGEFESFKDHRVAMSLACTGMAFPKSKSLVIKDAESCAVSFPNFFDVMKKAGMNFSVL